MIQGIYHGALLGLAVGLLLTALSYACPSKYCDVVWTRDMVLLQLHRICALCLYRDSTRSMVRHQR